MASGKFHVIDGELAGSNWPIPTDGSRFTIGRRSTCSLVLRIDTISREHCYVQYNDGDYWIYDNGSANATLLNGTPCEKAKLMHGDVVTLDRVTLEYLSDDGETGSISETEREFVVQNRPSLGSAYTPENSLIGKSVSNKYKVLSVLGEGGMAMVYKARANDDGKLVALKVLKGGSSAASSTVDPENRARLLKEFKAGTKLNHTNIMQVYDLCEHKGLPCIAMEYINGSSLQEILNEKGKLSPKATLKVGIQVARALEAALEQRIIHRDIKPENIMISHAGEVKVTDLGLAKELSQFVSVNITKTGEGIGTLHYMPPEQVENTKGVDHRADIYALGASLYECFCGQPPFDEVGVWKFVEAIQEKPVPNINERVDGLPDRIWPLLQKALEKKPDKRYKTPTEFRMEMESILAELG